MPRVRRHRPRRRTAGGSGSGRPVPARPSRRPRTRRGCASTSGSDATSRMARSASRSAQAAIEGRPHVVVVGQRVVHPGPLVRALHTARRPLGQLDVVGRRAGGPAHGRRPRPDAVSPVRAQRLQQPVAGAHRARRATTIDLSTSRAEQVQGVGLGRARVGAHGAPPARSAPPAKTDNRGEQPLLGLRQQPVGPVDRRGQALVPRRRGRAATAEQGRRRPADARPRPRSSPASGRRPARSPAAARRAARRSPATASASAAVGPEVGSDRPAPVARTAPRRRRAAAAAPATPAPRRPPSASRLVASTATPGQCATIRETSRAAAASTCSQLSTHQQQRPCRGDTRSRSARSSGRDAAARRSAAATAWPTGPPSARRRELAEPHPVGEPRPVPGRPPPPPAGTCRRRRRRSASPAAPARSAAPTPRDLLVRGRRDRSPRRGRLPFGRCRRRAPDRGRGSAGTAPAPASGGLDAQLVVEPGAQVVVGGQRVGLPAHGVQRPHERDRGSFPGRVASHQRLEPGQRLGGPTQLQQRQRTVFERAGAELGQPRDRGDRELVVGELGEGLAPPQRERRVEVGQRAGVIRRCGGGPCGTDELLELGRRRGWPRPGSGGTPADGAAARRQERGRCAAARRRPEAR